MMTYPVVSEPVVEALLAEINRYSIEACHAVAISDKEGKDPHIAGNTSSSGRSQQAQQLAAEMAVAKMERMGYSVGYRFCERLSQHKQWNVVLPPASGDAGSPPAYDEATIVAAQQLEAVKFLCKEVWTEIFQKQIDKLQTVRCVKDFWKPI
jgi:Transport protein particle (TRAPP) component